MAYLASGVWSLLRERVGLRASADGLRWSPVGGREHLLHPIGHNRRLSSRIDEPWLQRSSQRSQHRAMG